jgi:asparagine N-glycosylation enzyme membrane subunit Stt3
MFENTELFGISMASRTNRRALVAITYVFAALLIVASVLLARFVMGMPGRSLLKVVLGMFAWLPVFLVQIIIPGSGTFKGIFGRLVPEQTFSFRVPVIRSLGLARGVLCDLPEADEREIRVRNSAYFLAFKILARYAFVFLFACVVPLVNSEGAVARTVAVFASIPLVVMLFTLPQAIIIWTEPDLPVDVAE